MIRPPQNGNQGEITLFQEVTAILVPPQQVIRVQGQKPHGSLPHNTE
jgi:hypothetical protein